MRRLIPELVALPLLPLLWLQGRQARRATPRLPEAGGAASGVAGGGFEAAPLSLLALGESPVAGVGVATHEEALAAQCARALAERLRRPVGWRARGRNGATVGDALASPLPPPGGRLDIALVAFGVNDATAFRPVWRWRRELREFLARLDQAQQPRLILLSGVPPLECFPALPQPLRAVLGLKARQLDFAARELAARLPHVRHVGMALDPRDRALMAVDGFHPSARGYAAWGAGLADAAAPCFEPAPVVD